MRSIITISLLLFCVTFDSKSFAQVNANFSTSDEFGCTPFEVMMVNTSTGADSYLWNFGDGATSTDTTDTLYHTYINNSFTSDTTYILQLIAYDTAGVADTVVENIIIYPSPEINLTFSSNKGCPLFTDTFTSSTLGADFYYWDFGDGTFDTTTADTTFIHIYDNTIPDSNVIYYFSLIVENSFGCMDTVTIDITVYAKVTADFSASPDSVGCSPFTVNFVNASSPWANTYTWDFGDGTPNSNSQNPTHTFTSGVDTTYMVQLIASSAKCTDSITKTITVADINLVVSPTAVTICPSDSVTLTASGALTYSWSPGTGLSSTVGSSVIAYPSATTTYKVVGTDGGCSDSAYVTITVDSVTPAIADFTASNTVGCEGLTVTFNNTSTNASGYSWSFPGGTPGTSTIQNPVVTYNTAGTYDVSLTAFGCSADSSITKSGYITVSSYPVANITANGATSFCDGDSVELVSDTSNTYEWLLNGASTGGINMNYYAGTSGNYQVVVSNISGCTDTSAITSVTVYPLPTVNVTPSSPTICASGDSVTISASGALIYNWSPGTGLSSTVGSSVIAFPASNTTYTVVGTDGNGCTDSATVTVTIDSITPAVAGFTATNTTGCEGFTVTFNNTSTNATGFSWSFPGGVPGTSTIQNPVVTYPAAGTYDVTLTAFGCSADNTLPMTGYITVFPAVSGSIYSTDETAPGANDGIAWVEVIGGTFPYSYAWTPGGQITDTITGLGAATYSVTVTDFNSCTFTDSVTVGSGVGISESIVLRNEIKIYPNPACNFIYIESKGANIEKVKVLNTLGQVVFEKLANGNNLIQINTSEFTTGIYFLQTETKEAFVNHKISITR